MLQVCDHRKECRCETGWLPPDCETPTESEGSSKGSTTDTAFKIASYVFSFEDHKYDFLPLCISRCDNSNCCGCLCPDWDTSNWTGRLLLQAQKEHATCIQVRVQETNT